MARRSKASRRRANKRKRAVDLEPVPDPTPPLRGEGGRGGVLRPGEQSSGRAVVVEMGTGEPISDNALDHRDDLSDVDPDYVATGVPHVDRYVSAPTPDDHTRYVIDIPNRFVPWIEAKCTETGSTPSRLFDWCMRQVWRQDPTRTKGASLTRADFEEQT